MNPVSIEKGFGRLTDTINNAITVPKIVCQS